MKKILFLMSAWLFASQTYAANICAGYEQYCAYNGANRDLTIRNLNGNVETLSAILRRVTDPTTVTKINLSNNQLESLPVEIGNLVALTILDLSNNQLQALPVEIGNLVALTMLYLSSNQLQALPVEIGNLVALTTLNLFNNQLQALPVEIGNLVALTTLYLSSNQLQALPVEIANLVALTTLDLSYNQLQALNLPNSMINRSHQLAFVTPRTPANLAQVANTQSLRFEADEVTERAGVAAGRMDVGRMNVVGQEALTAQRHRIIENWGAFAAQNVALLQKYLPSTLDDARGQFAPIFQSLEQYFAGKQNEEKDAILLPLESENNLTLLRQYRSLRTDADRTGFHAKHPDFRAFYSAVLAKERRFRLKAAWMGARLVNQDQTAPHHAISYREAYQTWHYQGAIPTTLQLVVFTYNITGSPEWKAPFIRNWLSENVTIEECNLFFPFIRASSIGEALDSFEMRALVVALADNIEDDFSAFRLNEQNAFCFFRKLDAMHKKMKDQENNAVTEVLFMAMRGHNNSLLDWKETHKPACADGVYLHAVNAALEAAGSQALAVEIAPCHE